MVSRRRFLSNVPILAGTPLLAAALPGCVSSRAAQAADPDQHFRHGVASGDPLADRVILWTRVSADAGDAIPVRWVIAADPGFARPVSHGELLALPARDHTVKVDALGLEPGHTYYYRFETATARSPVGRTRTLPADDVARLRFAVASCSNYPFGYFNAYARIAARADLDAVIHLGDYLYEYAPGTYGDGTALGRVHHPPYEILSLADYRTRHAQYRTDPDLQEAHRQHPWLCIWDDHESANDAWRDGAGNHNPELGEGTWDDRRSAAVRAYQEWLPIRERSGANGPYIYRSFRFGRLAEVMLLDTRLHGRSEQIADPRDRAGLEAPERSMLGPDQEAWLAETLRAAERNGSRWKVIGQQLMFGQLTGEDGEILNTDQWDGYPAARTRLLDQLARERISDTVILSGDIHSAWAMDIAVDPLGPGYDPANGRGALAVELVTSSVTSPGPVSGTEPEIRDREARIVSERPHIHHVNLRERGYLLLDIDAQRARAEFWCTAAVTERTDGERLDAAFATRHGENHLRAVAGDAPPDPPAST